MADAFKGPPQNQGVIGRLVLDRALVDYGFDIYIGINGLTSETITIQGEDARGNLMDGPPIRYSLQGEPLEAGLVQNGSFVIRIDDIEEGWANLAFVKSGGMDSASLQIESAFDYVDAPRRRIEAGIVGSTVPSVDGWGYGGWGTMHWGG